MIKNIVKITLLNYLWKKYKAVIVSTVVLFFYFWLVGKLHEDYVSYSHLNNDTNNLGLSFVLKWLCFLVGLGLYLLVNARQNRKESVLEKMSSTAEKGNAKTAAEASSSSSADPFQHLREKEKLRSKADVIIERHK